MRFVNAELLQILQNKSVIYGDFILSSGEQSKYYIDCKKTTLNPKGLFLLTDIILNMIENDKIDTIGGMTLGADVIIGAVISQKPLNGFIVRKEIKNYGTKNKIEGEIKENARVVIVDDVVTTGDSILKVVDAVRGVGATVVKIISIVDRGEGTIEKFKRYGFDYFPIFTLSGVLKC